MFRVFLFRVFRVFCLGCLGCSCLGCGSEFGERAWRLPCADRAHAAKHAFEAVAGIPPTQPLLNFFRVFFSLGGRALPKPLPLQFPKPELPESGTVRNLKSPKPELFEPRTSLWGPPLVNGTLETRNRRKPNSRRGIALRVMQSRPEIPESNSLSVWLKANPRNWFTFGMESTRVNGILEAGNPRNRLPA